MFVIGESHRKRAQTRLNSASTRGHAIFTIRVVRGTISPNEEYLSKGQSLWCSQLSLVDLAGSERNSRTQTSGHQLREASCINNTLMTLRTCLEILRYNQQQGENKHIPYRDSRLTHLFKNYFEGKGSIKMVVCINPSSTDYDENIVSFFPHPFSTLYAHFIRIYVLASFKIRRDDQRNKACSY